jgi:hypothetical protein
MDPGEWADYSGAAPILLPVRLLPYWSGGYLPADDSDRSPDLELPNGRFRICTDFDFAHPKTDYDRVCALGGIPPVQVFPVGPGHGLTFATELDRLTWWAEERMLVNGGAFPAPALWGRVEWSDELDWRVAESDLVLMNACDHGAIPREDSTYRVHLIPGRYTVQYGQYGWADRDPSLVLFRFVWCRDAEPGAAPDRRGM